MFLVLQSTMYLVDGDRHRAASRRRQDAIAEQWIVEVAEVHGHPHGQHVVKPNLALGQHNRRNNALRYFSRPASRRAMREAQELRTYMGKASVLVAVAASRRHGVAGV